MPQLLDAVKPALCDLQTRRSSAFVCVCDIVPDENESALSIPQQYYISTITGWTDTSLEPGIKQAVRDRYRKALPVSCGTYIADYDVTCDDANVRLFFFKVKSLKVFRKAETDVLSRASPCLMPHFPDFWKFARSGTRATCFQITRSLL